MKYAHFLHIYQPYDQHPGILDKIVNESYRPLFRGLLKIPGARITLNVNGVLLELLFKHGYRDVIDSMKDLLESGKIELTGSAKYHAFLPLIPAEEVERQIALNHETLKRYFADLFEPRGFFPPEMGYSPKVAHAVEKLGYKWILIDEVALGGTKDHLRKTLYQIKGTNLKVFFREKRTSNLVMGALVRSAQSFLQTQKSRQGENAYVITAMDGETFGHHRPGFDQALFDILGSDKIENVLISDLLGDFKEVKEVMPIDSSWVPSAKEVAQGNPFTLWFDKSNKIHNYEWELATLAIETVNNSRFSDKNYPQLREETQNWESLSGEEKRVEKQKRAWVQARDALDKALNSDPWWWACAKPWWSVEMVEKGMNALYKVVLSVPVASAEAKNRAEDLYKNIIFTAHEWQRAGVVDKMAENDSQERRIPLSKRFGAGNYYKALLQALNEEEKKASANREYEKAIKWRDGQYKLERDLDIYDAVHVMDLFRVEGNFSRFQEILKEYQEKYRKISRGQPE